jgi:hypothetical protein
MYVLINTLEGNADCLGQALSCHRSKAAAEEADGRVQRAVKRANGQASYLPTCVVWIRGGTAGAWVYRSEVPHCSLCQARGEGAV